MMSIRKATGKTAENIAKNKKNSAIRKHKENETREKVRMRVMKCRRLKKEDTQEEKAHRPFNSAMALAKATAWAFFQCRSNFNNLMSH